MVRKDLLYLFSSFDFWLSGECLPSSSSSCWPPAVVWPLPPSRVSRSLADAVDVTDAALDGRVTWLESAAVDAAEGRLRLGRVSFLVSRSSSVSPRLTMIRRRQNAKYKVFHNRCPLNTYVKQTGQWIWDTLWVNESFHIINWHILDQLTKTFVYFVYIVAVLYV